MLEQQAIRYLDQVQYKNFLKVRKRKFLQNKISSHLHKSKNINYVKLYFVCNAMMNGPRGTQGHLIVLLILLYKKEH